MEKLKWYEGWSLEFRRHFCWLLGHGFKFEPMPGDTPPFEFSHCAFCSKTNPTFFGEL